MDRLRIGVRLESLGLPFRKALHEANRLGVQGVQFDAVGDFSPKNITDTGRRHILQMLRSHDLTLSALGCPLRQGLDTPEDQEPRLAHIRDVMTLSYELGCRIVIVEAGQVPENEEDPRHAWLTDSLRNLGQHGDRIGARLALETGLEPGSRLAEFLAKFQSAGLGVNFDPANLMMHNHDVYQSLQDLGAWIVHVHSQGRTSGERKSNGPRSSSRTRRHRLDAVCGDVGIARLQALANHRARIGREETCGHRSGCSFPESLRRGIIRHRDGEQSLFENSASGGREERFLVSVGDDFVLHTALQEVQVFVEFVQRLIDVVGFADTHLLSQLRQAESGDLQPFLQQADSTASVSERTAGPLRQEEAPNSRRGRVPLREESALPAGHRCRANGVVLDGDDLDCGVQIGKNKFLVNFARENEHVLVSGERKRRIRSTWSRSIRNSRRPATTRSWNSSRRRNTRWLKSGELARVRSFLSPVSTSLRCTSLPRNPFLPPG